MANGLALDKTNDLLIEDNNFVRSSNGAYVAQKVRSTLQLIQGELEDYPEEGIPYYSSVFQKPVDIASVASIFKSAILGVDGVNSLIKFNFELDTTSRIFILDFSVNTDWDEIEINDFTITQGGS